MSAENKAIIRRLIDEVWNQRKLDVLDEIFAPNAVIYDPSVPGLSRGPEGATQYVRLFWAAFPDTQVTADDIFAEGSPAMTETAERLKFELSRLSLRERAELAQFLIRSLDEEVEADAEAAWEAELAQW
jgi:hypothetical protein